MQSYTTGQVGRLCRVAPRTVAKWADCCGLQAYRIPGSRDRRILHQWLFSFLQKHNWPTSGLLNLADPAVLILTAEGNDDYWQDRVPAQVWSRTSIVANDFAASLAIGEMMPNVILIDDSVGMAAVLATCRGIRAMECFPPPAIVTLQESRQPIAIAGVEVFHKPYDPRLVQLRIRSLLRSQYLE